MDTARVRCLILGCGNTLRGDDGVGPFLCAWAEERFAGNPRVRVIARQQWTPELAEDVAKAEAVVFIDCSIAQEPGTIVLRDIVAAAFPSAGTHHFGAVELLSLARELFHAEPKRACLLTIGAASVELGEQLSSAVKTAVPDAQALLESNVGQLLR